MKVAIFGGAGNVGSEVSKFILDEFPDAHVTAIDNLSTGSMEKLRYLHSNSRFNFYLGSVEDIYFVELAVADATHIINCIDTYDKDRLISTVIQGTQNILDCISPEQRYIHFNFASDSHYTDLHNACHHSAQLLVWAYDTDRQNTNIHPRNTAVEYAYGDFNQEFINDTIKKRIIVFNPIAIV